MQNQGKESRFRRLASKLKGRETATRPTPPSNQPLEMFNTDHIDRQRAQSRYEEAANGLKEAVKCRKGPWTSFDFEALTGEPNGFDDSQFKNKINTTLTSWESSIKDRTGWSKLTYTVECVFTAFSPFAKNFLTVAKDVQSVMPI